jgi:hypothetical protein
VGAALQHCYLSVTFAAPVTSSANASFMSGVSGEKNVLEIFSTNNILGSFAVYWAGLNPNSYTSSGPTVLIKHTLSLMLSDVPTTVSARDIYLKSLENATVTVLQISSEWNINIALESDLPKRRRSSLTSNLAVSIVFTSISAGPGDLSTLLSKLYSPAFLKQLNAKGFKASLLELTSISGECFVYPIREFFRFLLHEITLLKAVYRFVY